MNKGHYASNKKWRLKNPEKRYESNKRYYGNNRLSIINIKNRKDEIKKRKRWTIDELKLITKPIAHRPSDRALSYILKRSMQAIQVQRSRIRNLLK